MTVAQLIKLLEEQPQHAIVVVALEDDIYTVQAVETLQPVPGKESLPPLTLLQLEEYVN